MKSTFPQVLFTLTAVIFSCIQCNGYGEEKRPVLTIPESIPADLSRDVTEDLNKFLASIPDGSIVQFSGKAKYQINGTVVLENRENLTLEGNGVFFRALDPGEDHDKKTSYTGWKKTRNRAHWRIKGGEQIVIRNFEVHGAHPKAGKSGIYDYSREAQHGFDLIGVKDCTLQNVNVHDVYGDCVYMAKVNGVVVRDSKLVRCGRQGVAVGTGEDVLIENNLIADSRRGIIDIEPYGKEWKTGNVRIIGNRLGGSRLLLLPMGGSGTVGTIFIADNTNTEQNGTPSIANTGKAEQHRGPFMMVNNQFTIGGSPTHGLRILHNDGVFIAGNKLRFPEHRKMRVFNLEGSRGAVVGNEFPGAATIFDSQGPENITLIKSNPTGENPPKTEWKRIPGGFAARTLLSDAEVVCLMKGGKKPNPAPEKIEGYGQSTTANFAWFHIRAGEIIGSGQRSPQVASEQ